MKINHILKNKGFTLIELMVAMAISGIIMTGIYWAFTTQQDSYRAQDQVAEMQQNIRAGLYIMTNDIRMAGFDPTGSAAAGIVTATSGRLGFSQDLNEDGDTDDPRESVTYGFSSANDVTADGIADAGSAPLGKNSGTTTGIGGNGFQSVAENIEKLEFYYTLEDDTQTTTPTVAQLDSIRSVDISILAITSHSDPHFINSQTYTSASGVDWTPASPDNFRRRFQTVTVKCRNMGL